MGHWILTRIYKANDRKMVDKIFEYLKIELTKNNKIYRSSTLVFVTIRSIDYI